MARGGLGLEERRRDGRRDERRLRSAYRLRAGTGREKEKRNGVSLVTWLRRLSGENFTGAATRGVAGGTVADINETE